MTTRQKSSWAVTCILAAITVWYAVTMIGLVRTEPVSEIDLTGPLLQVALAATTIGGIVLVVLGAEEFWVASVLVAGLLTAELAANATRLVLSRRPGEPAPAPA